MEPIRSTKPGVFSNVSMIVSIVWSLRIRQGRKCVLYHGVFVEGLVDHIGKNILDGRERSERVQEGCGRGGGIVPWGDRLHHSVHIPSCDGSTKLLRRYFVKRNSPCLLGSRE